MSEQAELISGPEVFTRTLHAWMELSMGRSMRAFMSWMSACGLTKSQIGALMRLYYQGECPITGIGDDLGDLYRSRQPAGGQTGPEGFDPAD